MALSAPVLSGLLPDAEAMAVIANSELLEESCRRLHRPPGRQNRSLA
jgi:hypothetical protein